MKALLVFSCVAALVVSLNACNHNPVDPSATDASARSAGVTSTSATGPHSLTAVDAATLPAAITTYISTNYAGATIKEALKDAQGNYVVAITVNSVVTVLAFKADGTFVKVLGGKRGRGHVSGDSTRHAPGDSLRHHFPGDSTKHVPGDSLRHHVPGDSTHHAPGDTLHRPKRRH